jgi:hypothetical protein
MTKQSPVAILQSSNPIAGEIAPLVVLRELVQLRAREKVVRVFVLEQARSDVGGVPSCRRRPPYLEMPRLMPHLKHQVRPDRLRRVRRQGHPDLVGYLVHDWR